MAAERVVVSGSSNQSGIDEEATNSLLLAEQLACRIMDEVQFGAGRAYHGRVVVFCILWHVRQPMLHIHPGARASE